MAPRKFNVLLSFVLELIAVFLNVLELNITFS